MTEQKKAGFTLVEIMIVVAIIGLLAAIGIPSFQKARANARKNSCINNLRMVESAKEQVGLEKNYAAAAAISFAEVAEYNVGKLAKRHKA